MLMLGTYIDHTYNEIFDIPLTTAIHNVHNWDFIYSRKKINVHINQWHVKRLCPMRNCQLTYRSNVFNYGCLFTNPTTCFFGSHHAMLFQEEDTSSCSFINPSSILSWATLLYNPQMKSTNGPHYFLPNLSFKLIMIGVII